MLNVSMFECINAQWPSVRLVHSRKIKEWRVKTCVLSLTVTIRLNRNLKVQTENLANTILII